LTPPRLLGAGAPQPGRLRPLSAFEIDFPQNVVRGQARDRLEAGWRNLCSLPFREAEFERRENAMNPLRSTLAAAIAALAAILILPAISAAWPPLHLADAPPDQLKWNVERLHRDPFKLIKAVPDPDNGNVRFVLEFTRAPSLTELYDWERAGGPLVFRFLDEDGVVLKSVTPKLDGEMLAKPGARFRLLLPLPDEKTLARTRSVAAD
jgi:hypothetical protein